MAASRLRRQRRSPRAVETGTATPEPTLIPEARVRFGSTMARTWRRRPDRALGTAWAALKRAAGPPPSTRRLNADRSTFLRIALTRRARP